MKLTSFDILRRPRVTEKGVHRQAADNAYTFEVHPRANKQQIKEAVHELFGVTVRQVRTMNYGGKTRRTRLGTGRTAGWKQAVVTLAEGETIEGV